MTPTIPGHTSPAAGFEVPLEMLAACHGRVQSQCATLQRLVPHLASQGADRSAQEAATAVMRYFDTAARDHHDDEEQDLFPALLSSSDAAQAASVQALTMALCADHRALEAHWVALRKALACVAAGNRSALSSAQVDLFVAAYQRHIAREDAELLPLAARLMDTAALDRVGLAMRARRGVTGGI